MRSPPQQPLTILEVTCRLKHFWVRPASTTRGPQATTDQARRSDPYVRLGAPALLLNRVPRTNTHPRRLGRDLLYGSKTVPDRTVPYLSVPTSPGAVSTLARKLGGRNRPLSAPCLQSYDPACCGCSQPALPTRFGKVTDKHLAILVLRDGRPSSSRLTAAACAKRDQDAHGPVRRGQVALQGELPAHLATHCLTFAK